MKICVDENKMAQFAFHRRGIIYFHFYQVGQRELVSFEDSSITLNGEEVIYTTLYSNFIIQNIDFWDN